MGHPYCCYHPKDRRHNITVRDKGYQPRKVIWCSICGAVLHKETSIDNVTRIWPAIKIKNGDKMAFPKDLMREEDVERYAGKLNDIFGRPESIGMDKFTKVASLIAEVHADGVLRGMKLITDTLCGDNDAPK